MDALDILTDLEHVVPYFQPIFNAEEHKIIGYEILGRYVGDKEEISLGSFFEDDMIPEEYRIEVENVVLSKALEIASSAGEKDLLWFVNRDAELLMMDDGEGFLQMVLSFQEKGVRPEHIVLEISDRHVQSHIEHLINYYKSYGIKIAMDKVGSESSYLNRIAGIEPEILKIDMSSLRSNNTGPAYLDVLHSLSILARKIGAAILFENIETPYQLQFAWKNGGRFYQGFYLKRPDHGLVDKEILKDKLKDEIHGFILSEKKRLQSFYDLRIELNSKFQELISKYKKEQSPSELLMALGDRMDGVAFRMYVCDEDGFQLSPNLYKAGNEWLLQPEYENKNWSWRPYFLENIIRMRGGKKGILSDRYSDIETGEVIRTFSLPLNEKEFLFVDLCASFLHVREGLF
ncbi:EAL domain-containing protein [Bacillus sp. ISL-35]|uniref:EAL domain-containing protein n=1 Tax=Bacillus sp. ISL-35 TaxID=2819122 RepID=UPI001BE60593|nr:EAL-associated domain-containing protein [Bacillus sp. ISL-35]MBT2678383.1 EAL domain-containing protein [Bacillus sp. ISL-35]MBT2705893.1 EAL domain-containing protein [Chryseobacterium sp. ISL-80]